MFGKLIKAISGSQKTEEAALPTVLDLTIGRTVQVDRLALDLLPDDLLFELEVPTLAITAQGLIDLTDDAEHAWVHRFYTDDDVMLQIMTGDRDGTSIREIALMVPLQSVYPEGKPAWDRWNARITAETFTTEDGTRFERAWFDDQPGSAEPVCFWEEIADDRDMSELRRIYQRSMMYIRNVGDTEELLLAITQEPEEGDNTGELMVGIALKQTDIGL